MYWYKSHMGGMYYTENMQDYDDLYCEQCGDSDWEIGEADSFQEAFDLLKGDCDVFGTGGYKLQCVFPLLCEAYDVRNPFPLSEEDDSETEADFFAVLTEVSKITKKPFAVYRCICAELQDDWTGQYEDMCIASSEKEAREILMPQVLSRIQEEGINATPIISKIQKASELRD